jgi:hypothetical protein
MPWLAWWGACSRQVSPASAIPLSLWMGRLQDGKHGLVWTQSPPPIGGQHYIVIDGPRGTVEQLPNPWQRPAGHQGRSVGAQGTVLQGMFTIFGLLEERSVLLNGKTADTRDD